MYAITCTYTRTHAQTCILNRCRSTTSDDGSEMLSDSKANAQDSFALLFKLFVFRNWPRSLLCSERTTNNTKHTFHFHFNAIQFHVHFSLSTSVLPSVFLFFRKRVFSSFFFHFKQIKKKHSVYFLIVILFVVCAHLNVQTPTNKSACIIVFLVSRLCAAFFFFFF